METRQQRLRHALIAVWTMAVIVFIYLPRLPSQIHSLTPYGWIHRLQCGGFEV